MVVSQMVPYPLLEPSTTGSPTRGGASASRSTRAACPLKSRRLILATLDEKDLGVVVENFVRDISTSAFAIAGRQYSISTNLPIWAALQVRRGPSRADNLDP